MELWISWFDCVLALRHACARKRTFLWMTLALVGFSSRGDLLGVTSFVLPAGRQVGHASSMARSIDASSISSIARH